MSRLLPFGLYFEEIPVEVSPTDEIYYSDQDSISYLTDNSGQRVPVVTASFMGKITHTNYSTKANQDPTDSDDIDDGRAPVRRLTETRTITETARESTDSDNAD